MTFNTPRCVCGQYDGETCPHQLCMRQTNVPPIAGNIPWPYPYYPPTNPMPNQINYPIYMAPTGCICPPGANRECENPTCPRKPRAQLSSQV